MSQDETTRKTLEEHAQRRRKFLKDSAKLAVTAPVVSLLLADGIKPAHAQAYETTTFLATEE